MTAVYAPVALPSPDLAPPPTPGQAADATTRSSTQAQWQKTAEGWNERAQERINRNRGRLGLAPIHDVLDYVLTDHAWLAADATLGPAPATPGQEIFQTGTWVLADATPQVGRAGRCLHLAAAAARAPRPRGDAPRSMTSVEHRAARASPHSPPKFRQFSGQSGASGSVPRGTVP